MPETRLWASEPQLLEREPCSLLRLIRGAAIQASSTVRRTRAALDSVDVDIASESGAGGSSRSRP